MNEASPLVSIVIPVRNGQPWLDKVLSGMLNQTLAHRAEIIVLDSGSNDDTLSILAKYPVRVIPIDPGDFNHGTTRNRGVREARGEYVVMTVQDAEPADERWLEKLLEGFDDDTVAAVCGQQIVAHELDKNPVDWFRPMSPPGKRKFHFADVQVFRQLAPAAKKSICGWDNVNAAYRRSALLNIPFRHLSFAEDGMWAKDALEAGYAIVYNTAARVKHYHFENPDYTFRRCLTVNYHSYRFFGVKPAVRGHQLRLILSNMKLLLKERKVPWKDKLRWLIFNFRQRQAMDRAAQVFNAALAMGDEELDRIHTQYCGTPPQALKPQ